MSTKNLGDLNQHLFDALDRLSGENVTRDKLEFEAVRAQQITGVAKEIIASGRLSLDAHKFRADYNPQERVETPALLEAGNSDKTEA